MLINKHTSVLLPEVIELLKPQKGGLYLDGTFGGGGHTQAILEKEAEVIAVDTDPDAIQRAYLLKEQYKKLQVYDLNFRDLNTLPLKDFDGMLFDLGVSSFQLDEADRGFSFRREGASDMRLDPRKGWSAGDFLEKATQDELIQAIRDYGEERQWKRVVNAILKSRNTGILQNTLSLAKLIADAIGFTPTQFRIHPATKSFQGIRIAVNGELEAISTLLPIAFSKLKMGGVLVVISFHSLEDRLVKRYFRKLGGMPEHEQDDTPQQMRQKWAEILTKKAICPTAYEQELNPRSRSAKMRAIKKIKDFIL